MMFEKIWSIRDKISSLCPFFDMESSGRPSMISPNAISYYHLRFGVIVLRDCALDTDATA